MNRVLSRFLAALAAAATVTIASAQVPCWYGDDGFDTGCCNTPHPNLPDFPEVKVQGVYACMLNCGLDRAYKVDVKLSKLDFQLCDTAVAELNVYPLTAGGPTITSKVIAKYARTWINANTGDQVWRFILNGDWEYGPSIGTLGCPQPPHANPSHAIGSIDYECDPSGTVPGTRVALNLSHMPGCLSHGPLSARPLPAASAHNDRSYHLVAPGNFVFVPGGDIAGPFREEDVRYSSPGSAFPSTYKCLSEAPIVDGELASVFKNCLCTTLSGGPWVHSEMKGTVQCGLSTFGFATVGGFDPVIPTGLAGMRLGQWVGPQWPGNVELTVYAGYMKYENPCASVAQANPHRVFGVGTLGTVGYLFNTPSLQPEKVFVDLQDSLVQSPSPGLPVVLKQIFGAPAWASLVWNLNPQP